MLNPQMIQAVINSKLDEILSGTLPEGFKEKFRSKDKIELVPENGEMFGMKCNSLHLSLTYKDTEIVFTHE